jgi:Tfp pilus assembly protein PilF
MHLNLGTTYFATRNVSAAETELLLALRLKPDSANVLNALGCVYLEQGRLDDSAEAFKSAIAFKPRWTDSHFNYGRLLKKSGQNDAALAEFRVAVKTGPLNATARLDLGAELADRGQLAEAEAELRESIRLYPSLQAQQDLADLLVRTGRDTEAISMLQEMAERYPYESMTHLKLGRLLESKGKTQEAVKEYQLVLEEDPRNAEALAAIRRLQSKENAPRPN